MTTNVQQLLSAFDALTTGEKQEAAVELLRRLSSTAPNDVSDEALTVLADEVFSALDAQEAGNAGS